MKSEKEKMLAGEWFDPHDEELTADRDRATRLMHRLNVECPGHDAAYRAALRELCPNAAGFIRAPFYCDYGYNIHIGEGSFVNFDCVFLDLAPIRIGRHTLIGPKCSCSPRTIRWTPTCVRQAAKPANRSPSATTAGWAAASSSVRASGSATAR